MAKQNSNGRSFRREGDSIIIKTDGLPTWPVPDPDADREYYIQVSVYGVDCAVEVRSDQPITIASLREIAAELTQVATGLEDDMPPL